MAKKSLYLIDATAFCYRAFYALSNLSTSAGQKTNAVYGFINILNKVLKEKKPGEIQKKSAPCLISSSMTMLLHSEVISRSLILPGICFSDHSLFLPWNPG